MILVIDNYDSFTYNLVQLIGRTTDKICVERNDALTSQDVDAKNPDGIVISPGPGRPKDSGICNEVVAKLGMNIPILGICLGHQVIGEVFGASVTYAPSLMHGKTSMIHHNASTLFDGIPDPFEATRYHSLVLQPESIPTCLEVTATTQDGVIMGVRHLSFPIEGVQFHPESIMTGEGSKLLSNWLKRLNLDS
ncbi:MAG: aminodeoxychorismate/anthranilate synthase component II [Bacteroidetes bacterium]|nr:aminodeoxychorismate/anthranilate synthase component II [Bacteroidota bacterium]MCY4234316.1 aminodeoxychorismate/anthranilate synthase component II [Bacteroidota bacterium]